MQKCPNCGEKTITNLSKFMLGPGRTIECRNCKARVSISWYTMLIMLPIIVLNLLDIPYSFEAFIATMIVYTYIHWKFIPLRVRKSKSLF